MSRADGRAVRVVLVDDQPLVRMGLATLIASEDGVELAGEAADGRAGLELIRRARPDVVLCDIRMPVLDGLGLLAEVASDADLAAVRVVMLTTFELDEYVFEALRLGASGFLLKDAEPAALLEAIHVVADGGSLLAPSVTRRVIEQFATPGRSAASQGRTAGGPAVGRPARGGPDHVRRVMAELTEREREIVSWVATGRSNQEIAQELVISSDTVRTHVSRAMVKLGARDRAQLVVFAYEAGL